MKITRAFPDIRSDNIDASKGFYRGLLGFDVSMEADKFLVFTGRAPILGARPEWHAGDRSRSHRTGAVSGPPDMSVIAAGVVDG